MTDKFIGLSGSSSAGLSLGSLLLELLSPGWRETLRRCAVMPSWDAKLYDQTLRTPDGPSFDEFVASGYIEPARGEPSRWVISDSLRQAILPTWWSGSGVPPGESPIPQPLANFARQVADVLHTEGRRVDELDQLLLADQEGAHALAEQLYNEADERFDLDSCRSILRVLESPWRFGLLDAALFHFRHDRSAYLSARLLWRMEYYQSGRYLRRRALEQALEDVLVVCL